MFGKKTRGTGFLILAICLLGNAPASAMNESPDPFGEGTVVLQQSTPQSDPSGTVAVGPSGEFGNSKKASTGSASSKYTVVRGDCLWKIAQRLLGNGARYWKIVQANKERYPSLLKNPNLIYPGWELIIPGASIPTSSSISSNKTGTGNNSGTSVPKVTPPAPGAKGGKALLGWLQQTGLTGDALRTAWAIGMKESGGNPSAYNGNTKTGDQSYGLFQINMIGSMGPARRKAYGLKSNDELFDPVVNCRVMMKLSKNGTNWGPWAIGPNSYKKTQTSPAFEKFYNMFPPK